MAQNSSPFSGPLEAIFSRSMLLMSEQLDALRRLFIGTALSSNESSRKSESASSSCFFSCYRPATA